MTAAQAGWRTPGCFEAIKEHRNSSTRFSRCASAWKRHCRCRFQGREHISPAAQLSDVIVLLCYSFSCMYVSIQFLAAIQINQLIDWYYAKCRVWQAGSLVADAAKTELLRCVPPRHYTTRPQFWQRSVASSSLVSIQKGGHRRLRCSMRDNSRFSFPRNIWRLI